MDRMKAISTILLLLSVTFVAGSCAPLRQGELCLFAPSQSSDLLGTGLVGWQQIGGRQDAWRFTDGVLYTEGDDGGWLATLRQYDNFTLSLEFRVSRGGNSGVFLRSPLEGDPAYAGMEIQILDDYAQEYSNLNPYQYTGSLYGVQVPSERVAKEAGKWQNMVITARGTRIEVVLNGRKIIDTDVTYHSYKAGMHPGLMRESGFIGLQNHGSRVEFRNIRIREL
ncbi:MAG: DUF1080 domain-containing protein [Phycisphaerae bacterium]|nr:DUF1080 domain-containing protein [Phycisphaerae bacterium]